MTSESTSGAFPFCRLRRTRKHVWCRELVAESRLHPSDLIWPVFIQEGARQETLIPSMPDVTRITLDLLVEKAKHAVQLGIPAIALFPVIDPSVKSPRGEEAFNPDGLVCRAIKALKKSCPTLGIITDIALDPYTSHGQDGILENGVILNDATIEVLCKQALSHAQAGSDIVAPSDMMDGRIGRIRSALEQQGYHDTMILAYSAKYASSMYSPFRDAVGSAAQLGKADKRSYQMDPANASEAMREIALDIQEGADMVLVKPGIAYLDIVQKASSTFNIPIFAYQVSAEYAMVKAADEKGWIDGNAVMLEMLLSFKRAGARAIFTYAACDVAKQIQS